MSEILVGYGPLVRLLPGECWSHRHPFNYVLRLMEGRIGLKVETTSHPRSKIIEAPDPGVPIPQGTAHLIANLSHHPLQLMCDEEGHCTIRYVPSIN